MDQDLLISIGIVVLSVAIGVGVVMFKYSRMKKKLGPLMNWIGGEIITSLWHGMYVKKTDEKGEIRFGLTPGSRNRPPMLYLDRLTPLGFDLYVVKNNFLSRGISSIGLRPGMKTGDPVFDEKYLVRSRDKIHADNFFNDARNRETVDALFVQGFDHLTSDKKRLRVCRRRYPKQFLEQGWVMKSMELFGRLT